MYRKPCARFRCRGANRSERVPAERYTVSRRYDRLGGLRSTLTAAKQSQIPDYQKKWMFVIYLSDTDLEHVHAVADEMVRTFNQSAVMIQTNQTKTEFYEGVD